MVFSCIISPCSKLWVLTLYLSPHSLSLSLSIYTHRHTVVLFFNSCHKFCIYKDFFIQPFVDITDLSFCRYPIAYKWHTSVFVSNPAQESSSINSFYMTNSFLENNFLKQISFSKVSIPIRFGPHFLVLSCAIISKLCVLYFSACQYFQHERVSTNGMNLLGVVAYLVHA